MNGRKPSLLVRLPAHRMPCRRALRATTAGLLALLLPLAFPAQAAAAAALRAPTAVAPGTPDDAMASALQAVEARRDSLVDAGRRIWEYAELALAETQSSALLAGLLEAEGFSVQRGVSGMPTAFVASFGSGHPVVAYLAEYDALPGLSQTVSSTIEPRIPGACGHGCGHNLFGTASVGAGLALKAAMVEHGLAGTVRVYGTPAEEQGLGKVYMVRDGLFDDVDACLSWHPSDVNQVSLQPSKALRSFEVTFFGRAAHAAGAPWEGVSALDALEAFTTGVNLLREHMPETARIHYVITEGGDAPNIVPSRARLWVYTRGKDWQEQEQLYQHVLAIVAGADLMAWGEEHGQAASGFRPAQVTDYTGLYHYNPNEALARLVHRNLEAVGPPQFVEAHHAFARELQQAFGVEPKGMDAQITPFDPHAPPEPGGSTDVANISWVCPTIDLEVANWPVDVPAHSWASTAASGSEGGLLALLTAAKVLARSGVDVLTQPEAVAAMRTEFEAASAAFPYVSPVGPEDVPRVPEHLQGR